MANGAPEVAIDWSASLDGIAGAIASAPGATTTGPPTLVPSSLRHDDPLLTELREALRRLDMRTTVLVPRAPVAALVRRGERHWRETAIDGPRYRIDARLTARPWTAMSVVEMRTRSGPFVLDLASRFLHPMDRMRLLARPDRNRDLADIAAAALPNRCLVLTPAAGGWLVLRTADPIAAELWSLALAERFLDQRLEMQGPWEDPTVQRATELELGLRIPGEMNVTVATTTMPTDSVHILQQAANRLGLGLPAR